MALDVCHVSSVWLRKDFMLCYRQCRLWFVWQVTQRTYEHIAEHEKFDDLRSTRHFGPMTFYLAIHRNLDSLLLDMLQRQL